MTKPPDLPMPEEVPSGEIIAATREFIRSMLNAYGDNALVRGGLASQLLYQGASLLHTVVGQEFVDKTLSELSKRMNGVDGELEWNEWFK